MKLSADDLPIDFHRHFIFELWFRPFTVLVKCENNITIYEWFCVNRMIRSVIYNTSAKLYELWENGYERFRYEFYSDVVAKMWSSDWSMHADFSPNNL